MSGSSAASAFEPLPVSTEEDGVPHPLTRISSSRGGDAKKKKKKKSRVEDVFLAASQSLFSREGDRVWEEDTSSWFKRTVKKDAPSSGHEEEDALPLGEVSLSQEDVFASQDAASNSQSPPPLSPSTPPPNSQDASRGTNLPSVSIGKESGDSSLHHLQQHHVQHQQEQDQQRENEGRRNKKLDWTLFLWPKCLRTKHSPKWVLFCLCWATAVQGMVVNGFVNVCITTIEKRYHLRSADAGLIAVAYDVASVLCSVPASYLGSLPGASKPRWLAWGMFLMGLGSFVFSFPHFVSPPYKDASSTLDASSERLFLCLSERNVSLECSDAAEVWLSSFRHVFALGQFLHGVGASPLYTLGITYLDESVPVRSSSLYLGVFYAMAIVGPACGYVLGGQLLNIYVDFPSVSSSKLGMHPTSDQWLGAWWIGFLLSGTLAVMIACALLTFPRQIQGSKVRCSQQLSEPTSVSPVASSHSFRNIKDLPKATKVLASNYTFVCLSLAGATEGVLLTGFATFMPKFIESQFSISASSAALLVGMVAVPAGGGGTLIGGWIIKHFYLKCAGILKLCTFLSAICFFSCLSFVISCPDASFAGVTVNYVNDTFIPYETKLISGCNEKCGCENVPFDPVCGADHILYFSPCHAGCSSVRIENDRKIFDDCKCIGSPLIPETEFPEFGSNSSAFLQKCPSSCSLMAIFLTIFFVIMTVTFILSLPAVTSTLRCVPDTHRSLALGIQWIFVRVLGTIPGPILFGLIIDSTCRLWQNTCHVVGACRNYDNLRMSRSMMAMSLVFKSLSTMFFVLALWFYSPPSRDHRAQQNSDVVSLDDTVVSTSTIASTPVVNENQTLG